MGKYEDVLVIPEGLDWLSPYLSTTLSSQSVQQMETFTFVLFTVVRFVPEEVDPYLPVHHSGGLILCFRKYVT